MRHFRPFSVLVLVTRSDLSNIKSNCCPNINFLSHHDCQCMSSHSSVNPDVLRAWCDAPSHFITPEQPAAPAEPQQSRGVPSVSLFSSRFRLNSHADSCYDNIPLVIASLQIPLLSTIGTRQQRSASEVWTSASGSTTK